MSTRPQRKFQKDQTTIEGQALDQLRRDIAIISCKWALQNGFGQEESNKIATEAVDAVTNIFAELDAGDEAVWTVPSIVSAISA